MVMAMIYKLTASILLAAIASCVNSTELATEWLPPTARENGVTLDVSEIAVYRIYKSTSDNQEMVAEVAGTNYTLTISDGECYLLSVTAVDTMGLESKQSNVVNFCASVPGAPTTFLIRLQ